MPSSPSRRSGSLANYAKRDGQLKLGPAPIGGERRHVELLGQRDAGAVREREPRPARHRTKRSGSKGLISVEGNDPQVELIERVPRRRFGYAVVGQFPDDLREIDRTHGRRLEHSGNLFGPRLVVEDREDSRSVQDGFTHARLRLDVPQSALPTEAAQAG